MDYSKYDAFSGLHILFQTDVHKLKHGKESPNQIKEWCTLLALIAKLLSTKIGQNVKNSWNLEFDKKKSQSNTGIYQFNDFTNNRQIYWQDY